tara:strand:+ start:373 stop:633 length:261 start_codon:yes stop_codon:yes gene_type:complete
MFHYKIKIMLDIEKRIKFIMSEVLDLNQDILNDDSSTNNLEEWDSMNHMNLIVALEEEFKCEFDEVDIENMISFKIMKKIIEKKLK